MIILASFKSPELQARLVEDMASYRIEFDGRAESTQTREGLRAFFVQADASLRARKVPKVDVAFKGLEFINSSCFKEFVVWLSSVMARPPAEHYRLLFQSNPKVRWQRASLHSLSTFAVDLVEIA